MSKQKTGGLDSRSPRQSFHSSPHKTICNIQVNINLIPGYKSERLFSR